jgi:hypothetical protein
MQPGSSLGFSLHAQLTPSLLPWRRAHASMDAAALQPSATLLAARRDAISAFASDFL